MAMVGANSFWVRSVLHAGLTSAVWVLLATGASGRPLPVRPNWPFLIDVWETDDGLPQNSVNCIEQTPDGYLWLGTSGGLVRFDGVDFDVFDKFNTPALQSSAVTAVFADREGRLWIGTSRGITMKQGSRWEHFGPTNGWPDALVLSFAESKQHEIIVSANNNRIYYFNGTRFQPFLSPRRGRASPPRLFCDTNGTVWVWGHNYLGRLENGRWTNVVLADDFPNGRLRAAGPARDGGIWLAIPAELRKFKDGAWTSIVTNAPTRWDSVTIFEDSQSNIWVTSDNGGLGFVSRNGHVGRLSKGKGLLDNNVHAILEDRFGNIWVGTDGGGLVRFKKRTFVTWSEDDHVLPQDVVRSVAEDSSGALLVAMRGGGLVRFVNGKFQQFPKQRDKDYDWAWSVLVDHTNQVWVGTRRNGLFRGDGEKLDPVKDPLLPSGLSVYSLFEDRDQNIWIGTDRGLMQWKDGVIRQFGPTNGLTGKKICTLAQAATGELWVGTDGDGLFRLIGDRFERLASEPELGSDEVWALHADWDGAVWIGTYGGGLTLWRDGQFFRFTRSQGIPANTITAILADGQEHLWLGSNRGVIRVSRADLKAVIEKGQTRVRAVLFDRTDGLESIECAEGCYPAAMRDRHGRLWFATFKGVSMVDPANLSFSPRPPTVAIKQVRVDDGLLSARDLETGTLTADGQSLRLAPGTSRISIRYTDLSLLPPEKMQFATMLVGADDDWTLVGSRRVAYLRDLAPGDYRFQVRAFNQDGASSESPTVFAFTIPPFYWQTWWFRGGGGFVLAGLVGLGGWAASRRNLRRRLATLEHETQLAHTKARLASVLENTSDFVSFSDPKGRVLFLNQAGRRIIGLGQDTDIEQRAVQHLHPPWAVKRIVDEGMVTAADKGVWQGESALRHREGYEIPVSQVIVAHRDRDGILNFFSSIARDIREAKRAEQIVREREERFRLVAEQTGQLVYDHDPRTGRIRWAGAIEPTTGYTPGEFSARMDLADWMEHIHPADRKETLSRWDEAVREGTRFQADYRFRRKDGSYVFVQQNGVFQVDAAGKPLRMLGALQDVTELRKAAEARELLRRVAQALTAPLSTRKIGLMLASECRTLFDHHAFFFDRIDDKSGHRSSVYCEDTEPGTKAPQEVPSSIDPTHPETIQTMFRGRPLLLNRDDQPDGTTLTRWGFQERISRSILMAPIRWENRCIGVLSVQSYTPGRYNEKDLELLQALADQSGAAVARAESDAALRGERNFVATLLDTVGSLVVVLDTGGRIVRFNKACTDVSGYSLEEVLGRCVWDFLLVPDEIEGAKAAFEDLKAGDFPRQYDNLWVAKDGTRRLITWSNTVLLDKEGRVEFLIGTGMDITDRVGAERALRESEQRFQVAVRGSSDGLWDWNLLTGEVYFSDRYKEQLGYAPEEFSNRSESFASHVHPADLPQVEAAKRAHLESKAPYDVEFRMRTKSGQYRWFRSRAQAVWDESGRPVRMAGSHTDVSDRRLAEEALRQGEALLKQTNRIALVGGWEFDVPTKRLTWTPELYHLHEVVAGFTPTIEESFNFFSPEGRAEVRRAFERCLHHGESWDLECEFVTHSGRRLWVHTQGEAQYEDGRVRRIVAALQNITRRKQAEETLRSVAAATAAFSGETFFRSLVEHLARALRVKSALVGEVNDSTLNRVRIVCHWSDNKLGEPFEYDVDGTPCAEVIGKALRFYPHSVLDHFPRAQLLRELSAESYLGAPIFDSERRPLGLLAVMHDQPMSEAEETISIVTIFAARAGAELERIRAEQQVRQLNADLEQRVRERTAQLVAANQEMQAFSYSVSHDLRAPLRHIAGFTNLLARNPVVIADADAQRQAAVVNEAARKMGQLIDDLLIFSRMGRAEMKQEEIDMNRLVGDTRRDLEADQAGRAIEWRCGDLPAVLADPAMVRQVWLNLLGNAIKYTGQREKAVIEIQSQDNDDYFVFSVKDNGAGFDAKYADKLFGVFQRLHRDDEFEGTGIGLANVRRVIHRHGGQTWATGAPEQGATFYFSLPKVPPEIESLEPLREGPSPPP